MTKPEVVAAALERGRVAIRIMAITYSWIVGAGVLGVIAAIFTVGWGAINLAVVAVVVGAVINVAWLWMVERNLRLSVEHYTEASKGDPNGSVRP